LGLILAGSKRSQTTDLTLLCMRNLLIKYTLPHRKNYAQICAKTFTLLRAETFRTSTHFVLQI